MFDNVKVKNVDVDELIRNAVYLDVDECATGAFTCTANSYCSNKVDGYDCMCVAGYTMIGGLCQNVDECNGVNVCNAQLGTCVDEDGSYR